MSSLLAFSIGVGLPSLTGWFVLQSLEGNTRVLGRPFCCALGFLLGVALSMFVLFFLSGILSLPLSRTTVLLTEGILLLLSGILWFLRCRGTPVVSPAPSSPSLSNLQWCGVALLGTWIFFKTVVAAGTFLLLVPTYFDDSFDNWNLRAKVFHHTQAFSLQLPGETLQASLTGISSYPPMVPLFKASLTLLYGDWSEPLMSSVHILWYLCILVLIFGALKRICSLPWALLGAYLFSSLPLPLLHGTNAYADAFLSAHICAALLPIALAWHAQEEPERMTLLRIAAIFLALLPFIKNEGMLLYFPPMLLIFAGSLWWMARRSLIGRKEAVAVALWSACCIFVFVLPWLLFKWSNGMSFGNAKPVGSLALSWQETVLQAIAVNTFFEGNWLLLFPAFFLALMLQNRAACRPPLLPLTTFFLILYFGQMPIFMFTPLSTEAIRQTGYARGLVHLAPIAVTLTTVLLAKLWNEKVRRT
jgi:hypothetical protein